jgi:hypothetical protein
MRASLKRLDWSEDSVMDGVKSKKTVRTGLHRPGTVQLQRRPVQRPAMNFVVSIGGSGPADVHRNLIWAT